MLQHQQCAASPLIWVSPVIGDPEPPPPAADVMSAALKSGLKAYWSLNENGAATRVSRVNSPDFDLLSYATSAYYVGRGAGVQGDYDAWHSDEDTGVSAWLGMFDHVQLTSFGTVAFWITPNLDTRAQWVGFALDAAGAALWYFVINAGQFLAVAQTEAGSEFFIKSVAISLNTRTHVVFADRRATTGKYELLLNGALAADLTTAAGYNFAGGSGIFRVQLFSSPAEAEDFVGRLDEFGIWDRALTDSEIAQLYNGGAGRLYA